MLGIDDNRLKHMRSVAELMYLLSKYIFGNNEKIARKHYLIGFTHDIGYRFSENQREHELIGSIILRSVGASIDDTIRLHGEPLTGMSDDLLLLNLCDMRTSKEGNYITFAERLTDIADRYGFDSEQYVRAQQVITNVEAMVANEGVVIPDDLSAWVEAVSSG